MTPCLGSHCFPSSSYKGKQRALPRGHSDDDDDNDNNPAHGQIIPLSLVGNSAYEAYVLILSSFTLHLFVAAPRLAFAVRFTSSAPPPRCWSSSGLDQLVHCISVHIGAFSCRSRAPQSLTLSHLYSVYTIPVTAGKGKQTLYLQVDSGSSDLVRTHFKSCYSSKSISSLAVDSVNILFHDSLSANKRPSLRLFTCNANEHTVFHRLRTGPCRWSNRLGRSPSGQLLDPESGYV